MPHRQNKIIHVALAVPLRRCFDYLSINDKAIMPGMRVSVPFGKSGSRTGIVVKTSSDSELPISKLKKNHKVIDESPLFSASHLKFLLWASDYYQHPPGEVILNTLPVFLKQGKPAIVHIDKCWELTEAGQKYDLEKLRRAPVQRAIFKYLSAEGIATLELVRQKKWSSAITALHKKGLIKQTENVTHQAKSPITKTVKLNEAQQKTVNSIVNDFGHFKTHLIYGLTGSGKTEVYINIIKAIVARGLQALVLVPEIGLTPQLLDRFNTQLGSSLVVLHSGVPASERLQAWVKARDGKVQVILGTRSAIWTPLRAPGVIIVDEEHDLSYKQQDGFRYSARDVAIMRASMDKIPIILGSATPSMESLHNVDRGKYILHKLEYRAAKAEPPTLHMINLCNQQMTGALSPSLISAIKNEINKKHQVLLFLNKRGYSPVLMCHHCGWINKCERCDVQRTYHKYEKKLTCHHCGSQSSVPESCPDCHEREIIQIGHGTERLTETLHSVFPEARILRIDRDSTRRKGTLDQMFKKIHDLEVDIIIGTQMLAKGHHFPSLNLVGIVDADRGLFSADYRATEQMAQLILQVSGRAGRNSRKGIVLLQTHYPNHPHLKSLVNSGYDEISRQLLEERKLAELPPYSYQALLRSEDVSDKTNLTFLNESRALLSENGPGLEVFGPYAAPMAKRAGRKRYQLLVQSTNRRDLGDILRTWVLDLEKLQSGRKVRWSLDIDPMDML